MQCALLVCGLLLGPALAAQTDSADAHPQMTWQGEVDGVTLLYVHGKRLKIENKNGSEAASNQRYRVREPLPPNRQDVRLQIAEGRGYVHILEQPRADNDYTLAISIEDRQPGSSFYSIALYWDTGDLYERTSNRGRNQLKWSGRVEDEAIVSCAGARCTSEVVRGNPVMHERSKLAHPLPSQAVTVNLDNIEGRGELRIVQQPAEANGYTARVQIRDPQAGAGDYAFTLTWAAPLRGKVDPVPPQPGLLWAGNVQGAVRITVRGGAAFSEVVNNAQIESERAAFDHPLPSRSDLKPAIRKRQGRGPVEIVEYPTAANGYRLIFEVRDAGPGTDHYEVEVSW